MEQKESEGERIACITYPPTEKGYGLVQWLEKLDIRHFPINMDMNDEPELAFPDGRSFIGFEEIEQYLHRYQLLGTCVLLVGERSKN